MIMIEDMNERDNWKSYMKVKELKSTEFEKFVMKCCRMEEYNLRPWLKKLLINAGFSIKEDNYKSIRGGKFENIPNMLATRGVNPKVALACHTDVCREYGWKANSKSKVDPVLIERRAKYPEDKLVRIITDRTGMTQVGGDDRCGCAINTYIALNSGYPLSLLYFTDEESGCLSSSECEFDELSSFSLVIQTDRGHPTEDQLVVKIGGTQLCSKPMAERLLAIAHNIGFPRNSINGLMTDVLSLRRANKVSEAVNMTVGYSNNHQDNEFIFSHKAEEAMKYVSAIIKDFEMESINEIEGVSDQEEENDKSLDNDTMEKWKSPTWQEYA